MNELVKITEHNGKKAVSARELYERLGFNPSNWVKYYKKNILENPYASENQDWVTLVLSTNGNTTKDFVLTIDFAKKLCMLARTEMGEKVRNYFIEVEKSAALPKAVEPEEALMQTLQLMMDQKKRLFKVEEDVKYLKAQSITRSDYISVPGFASLHRKFIPNSTAKIIGKKATAYCKKEGIEYSDIPDPRFGRVHVYPPEILDIVFADYYRHMEPERQLLF